MLLCSSDVISTGIKLKSGNWKRGQSEYSHICFSSVLSILWVFVSQCVLVASSMGIPEAHQKCRVSGLHQTARTRVCILTQFPGDYCAY